MKRIFLLLGVLITFSSLSQHTNVLITKAGQPNEPAIMLDPLHPEIMIAGANTDHYYLSADTGKTWSGGILTSPYGVWGDPCIVVDTNSDFYFLHLANIAGGNWIDRIVCQKTTDNGQTWSQGTYMGLNGSKAQDKEWAIIDRNDNTIYVTWTQFDDYGSTDPMDSTHIMFSRSTDGGDTWLPAKRIDEVGGDCVDGDETVEGAVPAVGPNGEVYVAWTGSEGVVFDRSFDKGDTWLQEDIKVADMPGGWKFTIPGISRCNGLPVTVCDLSGGPNHGTIYINWTDQRNGTDDTDVWLVKSTDGGDTWSAPVRVNNDLTHTHQFLSWMTVDQVTGYLYFVFYDRRDHLDNYTDVYMAVSTDGGQSFINQRINETPFSPNVNVFFGDYTNIVAHNGIIRPVWTQMKIQTMSMYTALVDFDVLTGVKESPQAAFESPVLEQNYPNPVIDVTQLGFKLYQSATVSLSLYDMMGRKKATLIDGEYYSYGKHVLQVSTSSLGLSKGLYFYELSTPKNVIRKKMMILK